MAVFGREELSGLPASPGVYMMLDGSGGILYVGKAVQLRSRVRSYFRAHIGRGPAIDRMVEQVESVEVIVTDSELEALVLENNLIKEHNPKYNTLLKDDKTYPYIKVSLGEAYPRVLFSRTRKKDKARYFGPFTGGVPVKEVIDLINKAYGLRTCHRVLPRDTGRERPCLNYHIHQCPAPCQAYISQEEYGRAVEEALVFLGGEYGPIMEKLRQRMEAAAEALDFEAAAHWRDMQASVQRIAQKQKMTGGAGEDRDVIGLAMEGEEALAQIFFVRDGKLIGREHFYLTQAGGRPMEEVLEGFVKQFYAGTPFVPAEVALPCALEDAVLLEQWLGLRRGGRVRLAHPQKGQKEKLVELACQNASLILGKNREKLQREEGRTLGAVRELAQALGLSALDRIEAYDISNQNGYENVGSMVVYQGGRPKKSDYRKFRIRGVQGANDFASMGEMLERRFRHGLEERAGGAQAGAFSLFPDLLLMDGGRAQVHSAQAALAKLGLDIPVCGMVKDGAHKTKALYWQEEELELDRRGQAFLLVSRIQEEVHRFAITYHRSLRGKKQVKSVLDDIPGIGPARRKALMGYFPSIDHIRQADVDTLQMGGVLPRQVAEGIYSYFRREESQE